MWWAITKRKGRRLITKGSFFSHSPFGFPFSLSLSFGFQVWGPWMMNCPWEKFAPQAGKYVIVFIQIHLWFFSLVLLCLRGGTASRMSLLWVAIIPLCEGRIELGEETLFAWTYCLAYQPWYSVFLSQQISQQYFSSWANRLAWGMKKFTVLWHEFQLGSNYHLKNKRSCAERKE